MVVKKQKLRLRALPRISTLLLFVLVIELGGCAGSRPSQPLFDPEFVARVERPAYGLGTGPKVFIDQGHNNFHTMQGRYRPFAEVLRADGYQVMSHQGVFTLQAVQQVDILVISNALHASNIRSWALPTPSAFSDEEIALVNQWVSLGGALWLIADHMPIPGATEALALSFGFELMNGFAYGPDEKGFIRFSKEDDTLMEHAITRGVDATETVRWVLTFTGHAFQPPALAQAILVFKDDSYSLNPQRAFKFDEDTERKDISGWSQGAVMRYGKGKIAMFGEAAAFTAQLSGKAGHKTGINSSRAPDNQQFLLNIAHRLSGYLPEE